MKESRELESTVIPGSNEIRGFHIHLMRQTLLFKLSKTSFADMKITNCHSIQNLCSFTTSCFKAILEANVLSLNGTS